MFIALVRSTGRLAIVRRFLFFALVPAAVVAGFIAWFVQDADRFKPVLVDRLERIAGVPVEIRGSLAWRFEPRLWLVAEELHATRFDRAWSVGRLAVRPEIFSLVRRPGTPARWRIEEAVVRELAMEELGVPVEEASASANEAGVAISEAGVVARETGVAANGTAAPVNRVGAAANETGDAVEGAGGLIRVPRLGIRNLGLGEPASVEALMVYRADGRQTVEVAVAGTLVLETHGFGARDLSFRSQGATGKCDLQATPNGRLWPPLEPVENGILPIGAMRAWDWDGRCEVERIEYRGETIEGVTAVLDNKEGGSVFSIDAPDFLGGKAQLEAIVRADGRPVTWDLRPVLLGVDSRRLVAWAGGDSPIAGAVDFAGSIRMAGNTPAALAASMDADIRFSGGPGEFDGAALAAPLAEASALLNSCDTPTAVSAKLPYEYLSGAWVADGERHRLELALDSLRVEAGGDYLVKEDRLDLRGVIDPGDSIERWGLAPARICHQLAAADADALAPAVAGTPIHFRCRGPAADPHCRLDAKRTLAGASAAEGSAVASRLIDRHVPEEYRAAARSLLDLLEAEVDAALRRDPDELIGEHLPEKYQGMARSLLDKPDE